MLERRKERKRVNELFTPLNSLFSKMDYDFQIISKDKLDLIFILSEGDRYVNSIVDYYVTDDEISEAKMIALAALTLDYYKERWDRLIAVYEIEYDPIHNFSDELHEQIADEENTGTTNTGTQLTEGTRENTGTQKIEEIIVNSGTQENEGQQDGTDNDLIYGLNSSQGVGANDQIRTATSSNTRTDNLREEDNTTRTDNLKREDSTTRTDNLSEDVDRDYSRDRSVSRIGNIGNITTQQMLTEEIALWKWNFVWEVIDDVKNFLTLRLYKSPLI